MEKVTLVKDRCSPVTEIATKEESVDVHLEDDTDMEDADPSCIQPSPDQSSFVRCQFHVLYSHSYSVPVLFFNICRPVSARGSAVEICTACFQCLREEALSERSVVSPWEKTGPGRSVEPSARRVPSQNSGSQVGHYYTTGASLPGHTFLHPTSLSHGQSHVTGTRCHRYKVLPDQVAEQCRASGGPPPSSHLCHSL
ncbi:uncharacterized protein [Littorina saxatilis]